MTLGTDEQLQRALELAYAYLNRRDRTISEVRLALQRKGISESLTEAAITTLTEQRFLDDNRFAQLYVSDKRELEQWGSARIRRGLLARGVDPELADAALAGSEAGDGGQESELDRARTLLRRRFAVPPAARRDRERALGLLLRKGYEPELALDALAAHVRDD